MKLETYLMIKSVVAGVALLVGTIWTVCYVRSEVKYEEEKYKRELKKK